MLSKSNRPEPNRIAPISSEIRLGCGRCGSGYVEWDDCPLFSIPVCYVLFYVWFGLDFGFWFFNMLYESPRR